MLIRRAFKGAALQPADAVHHFPSGHSGHYLPVSGHPSGYFRDYPVQLEPVPCHGAVLYFSPALLFQLHGEHELRNILELKDQMVRQEYEMVRQLQQEQQSLSHDLKEPPFSHGHPAGKEGKMPKGGPELYRPAGHSLGTGTLHMDRHLHPGCAFKPYQKPLHPVSYNIYGTGRRR